MRLVVRIADEPFVVLIRAPERWTERRAEDVVQLVVKKSAEILKSREKNPPKWLPSRVAEVEIRHENEAVDRLAPVDGCRELTLWPRREWRCRNFDVVPGDALREAFAYAGGKLESYRVVSRRFRDEANAVVRSVRLPPQFSAHSAFSFRKAEVVNASAVEKGLSRSLPLFSRLRALDLSCARAADLDDLWPRLPPLRRLDASFLSTFDDAALAVVARVCQQLAGLDVTGTRVSAIRRFPALTRVAADATVFSRGGFFDDDDEHKRGLETFAATGSDSDREKLDTDTLVTQLRTCRRLTSLRLARCHGLRDDHLLSLRQLPLTDVDLSFSAISDLGIALLFAARLGTVELRTTPPTPLSLNLRGCDALTDAALATLADPGGGGHRLRDLDLELLWRLTADAILGLAQNQPSLRRVFVRGAASVNRKRIRDHLPPSVTVVFSPRFPTKGTADFLRGAPAPLRSLPLSPSSALQPPVGLPQQRGAVPGAAPAPDVENTAHSRG